MKAKREVKRGGRMPKFDGSPYPRPVTKLTETLARMWIECDPNRGGSPDEPMSFDGESDLNGKPRWNWFIPRAQASEDYLRDAGYDLTLSLSKEGGEE